MRAVRISEDIVPVSDFKTQTAEWLKRVAETGLVITQNGEAAGVLLSPAQFDALSARAHSVAAIDEGLTDSEDGRVHSHAALGAEFKKGRRTRSARCRVARLQRTGFARR